MNKFNSRERVTYDELCHFIQPLKMEIPIRLQNTFVYNDSLFTYFREINKEVVESLFSDLDQNKKEYIKNIIPVAYVPHVDGYSISFSPIFYVKSIIKALGRLNGVNLDDYIIPFYNLDDKRELEIFKESVRNRINSIKKRIVNENFSKDLDILNNSLDELIKIKDLKIEKMISNCVEMKTLLFYIVYNSLKRLKIYNNPIYSVLPMTYMEEVIKPDALQFPKSVYVDTNSYKYSINNFYNEYNKLYQSNSKLFNHLATDNLGVNTYIGSFELLPSGDAIKRLKDNAVKQVRKSTLDYAKYYKLFKTKMDYYFHTDIKHILVGNMGLEGYYAFVYGNEYVVADKFYNSLLVPEQKRSILTHEEGIYAVPSDRLDALAMNKTKLMEEKKKDARIKKHNHDQKNNWINRVNAIIEGANVSTKLFINELPELEKKGILTLCK